MSIPGQTIGMAIFTGHFMREFELSRTELSTAYLVGTLASSMFMRKAGRFYDSGGARLSMVASSVGLALFVSYIAMIDLIGSHLVGFTAISLSTATLPMIMLGYFGVRFMGQGVLANASRNVLLLWFDRRRGIVNGAHNVCVTFCFSIAPVVLALMITSLGWRQCLFVLAAVVGLGFGAIAFIFVRDSPEQFGLRPDGGAATQGTVDRSVPERTATEAVRSAVFWLYVSAIALFSLFITAMTFHIVAIFEESGRTAGQAFAYFVPLAAVSVTTNMLASWLSDYRPLKSLLIIKLAAFIVGAWGLINLQLALGYNLAIVGLGITTGLWGTLTSLFVVRFFGRQHLGEINGINSMFAVLGSAVGPVFFSLSKDQFGTFDGAIWASIVSLTILLIIAALLPQVDSSQNSQDSRSE
ncbi:MAG: MFS transporter [Pseudomonadales bacterium]